MAAKVSIIIVSRSLSTSELEDECNRMLAKHLEPCLSQQTIKAYVVPDDDAFEEDIMDEYFTK